MAEFRENYKAYHTCFENILADFIKKTDCKPTVLSDSIKYSLNIGGKRIRPVIMFSVGDLLGIGRDKLCNAALALELIHTYSLIHDDLPEMDNDDFRRGKPSNHKVFGTGNAVLAGDALLNTAYSILFDEAFKGNEYLSAAKYICDCAGIYGMIAGQSADLLHEGDKTVNEEVLEFIYENKTAKLITAAAVVPAIIGGGKYFSELASFGHNLGYLFQLTDDILDVEGSFESLGKSTGKDVAEGKYTGVRLYGLEECKIKADLITDKCIRLIECFDGDTEFLKQLIYFIRQRIQ